MQMTKTGIFLRKQQLALLLIPVFFINACAMSIPGSDQSSPAIESFSTRITGNGTKLFVYQLELPIDKNARTEADERHYERTGLPKEYYFNRHIKSKIDTRLKQKIASTGFCTTGYITLDRIIGKSSASIRGECKEGYSS
jgi:hypothetical protein